MDYKQILTLEDACKVNGTTPVQVLPYDPATTLTPKQLWLNAAATLDEVATAIKKGSEPLDYSNDDQYKWFPWFEWEESKAGFGFSHSDYDYSGTRTNLGARLSFPEEAMAEFIGKQFEEVYKVFLSPQQ